MRSRGRTDALAATAGSDGSSGISDMASSRAFRGPEGFEYCPLRCTKHKQFSLVTSTSVDTAYLTTLRSNASDPLSFVSTTPPLQLGFESPRGFMYRYIV